MNILFVYVIAYVSQTEVILYKTYSQKSQRDAVEQ